MNRSRFFLPALCLLIASACGQEAADDSVDDGSDESTEAAEAKRAPACTTDGGAPRPDPGTGTSEYPLQWKTDEFELAPGQERYLCFTKPMDEDVVINGYSTDGAPYVHHLIYSRVRGAKEQPGFQECDIAFRFSWDPLFITGAGAAKLDFPSDAGVKVAKGTQMIVQMHLLNVTDKPVKGSVAINMRPTHVKNPRPVASYVFGNPKVNLPPHQESTLSGDCKMSQKVQIIAGFPHMHTLGTSMTFSVGSSESTLKEVWKRDPYSFHDQRIDDVTMDLKPGDLTRVTCKWNNTRDMTVGYGESTNDEMCYFIGFAIGRQNTGGCMKSLPPGILEQMLGLGGKK